MIKDVFWIGCQNSPVTGPGIEISVAIDTGRFSSDYQSVVFYGQAPSANGNHPAQYYSTGPSNLDFAGNIYSLYCELEIFSEGPFIKGTISTKQLAGGGQGIPIPISIGTRSGSRFTMPSAEVTAVFSLRVAGSTNASYSRFSGLLMEAVRKAGA